VAGDLFDVRVGGYGDELLAADTVGVVVFGELPNVVLCLLLVVFVAPLAFALPWRTYTEIK